jgi:transposase
VNHLFALNRKVNKAYPLEESLERLWTYTYEGAMLRYMKSWTLQLRSQRLPAFEKLAHLLIDHLDGILNYCRLKVCFGLAGGHQRQYQKYPAAGRRLQESTLLAPQGSAHDSPQN